MARPGITVDVNFVDDAQTINLNVPFDWTGRDLVNLVGQLVEQGNERQFYGAIEAPPRTLGNIEGAYPEDDTFGGDADFTKKVRVAKKFRLRMIPKKGNRNGKQTRKT